MVTLMSKELRSFLKYHVLVLEILYCSARQANFLQVAGSIPPVVRHNFQLARCVYRLQNTTKIKLNNRHSFVTVETAESNIPPSVQGLL